MDAYRLNMMAMMQTGAPATGGGGGASAPLLSSYGRDEKILTAAAAGLGASVLATIGLWAGVAYGCGSGDSGSIQSHDSSTSSLKSIIKSLFDTGRTNRDVITLNITYTSGETTSIPKSIELIIITRVSVPENKAGNIPEYIQDILSAEFINGAQPSTGLKDIRASLMTSANYSVTFEFDNNMNAESFWSQTK